VTAHRLFDPASSAGLRLGLGGAPLGNLFSAVTEAQAQELLAAAWEHGCRCFDTAPHYGNGLSDHRIGYALRSRPASDFVLSAAEFWAALRRRGLLPPDAPTP